MPSKISSEQWDAHKSTIEELYFAKNLPLPKVMAIMEAEHGFRGSSERMYKSKLAHWSVQRKKLDKYLYNAMWVVMYVLETKFLYRSIVWMTRSATGEILHDARKICKELRRKTANGDFNTVSMNFAAALQRLLEPAKVEIKAFHQDNYQDNHQEIDLSEIKKMTITANERDEAQNVALSPSPCPETPASESFDDRGYQSNEGLSPETGITLCVHLAPETSDSGRRVPSVYAPSSTYTSCPGYTPASACTPSSASTLSSMSSPRSSYTPSPPPTPLSKRECPRCPTQHEDFELGMQLDTCKNSPLVFRTWASASNIDEKAKIGLWAIPIVSELLEAKTDSRQTLLMREEHMNGLRAVLDISEGNRYLLPCLNWMACILVYNCFTEELLDVLDEVCRLIDLSPNSLLRLPFQMLAASLRNDKPLVHKLGSQLASSYETVRSTFGDIHPNTIVFQCYYAWYLTHGKEQHRLAQTMLRGVLPVVKRRLGAHDTLAISCDFILANCYVELGEPWKAVEVLTDAIHNMGHAFSHMNGYRLAMMSLRAQAYRLTGKMQTALAERDFREVAEGRMSLFGMGTHNPRAAEYVREPFEELRMLLEESGKYEEAWQVRDDYVAKFREERQAWYTDRGLKVPPEGQYSAPYLAKYRKFVSKLTADC